MSRLIPTTRILGASALSIVAALLVACGGDELPVADPTSSRSVAQGDLVGSRTGEAHVWRGIPFAAPPEGALRWKAPSPPAPWTGRREALAFGPTCPQFDGSGEFGGEEDCLTLNVYAPAVGPEAVPAGADRLPVMFFIHGGGNSIGSAEVYDASRLASENRLVVVTVQYRLGVLGWFSHPALRAGVSDPADLSGNFGTLDLIRALEWVRENASVFGGDPDRVTIFGESAGGVNVYSLLLSPAAEGLFRRAISESGLVRSFTRAEAERASDDPDVPGEPGSSTDVILSLLEIEGRAGSREEARALLSETPPDELAGWLRAKTAAELLAPFRGAVFGGMYSAPSVLRDGHVIVDMDPMDALRAGAHHRVPAILGTNRDEIRLFQAFGSPHVRRIGPFPIGFKDERRYQLVTEYGSRLWKARGADEPATAMTASGGAASAGPGIYGYRFDWDEEPSILGVDLARLIGAGHAVELLFVFGGTDSAFAQRFFIDDAESAALLSRQMRSYWAEFAATGNPGRGQSGDLPLWPVWRPKASAFLVFDSARDAGLHVSNEIESVDGLVASVAGDERLAGAEERCEIYAGFVGWGEVLTPEAYGSINGAECTAYPLDLPTPFD